MDLEPVPSPGLARQTILSCESVMDKDKKAAPPQEPPKIDMKALNTVVKKVDYGSAKANRQSKPDK